MLKKINISGICKGVLFSIILTFLLLLLIAALCYFLTVSEKIMTISVFIATGLSVFLGALVVARSADGSGLLHGLVLGIIYLLITLLAELIFEKNITFSPQFLSSLLCVLSTGMLGGILGINSKK